MILSLSGGIWELIGLGLDVEICGDVYRNQQHNWILITYSDLQCLLSL